MFTRSLNISQASGAEVSIDLFLSEKPIREEQKLTTLSKYIQKYPSGWKKRLELANLLYGMGKWSEAVEEFYQVIERQPQLISVRLKLGKILQLMGKEKEAIDIYESTLSLVASLKFSFPSTAQINSNLATQSHITGLIEVCRHNLSLAINAFHSATTLEPDNPSHWLALGQVQQSIGNPLDAIKSFEKILTYHQDDLIALINIYDALIALASKENQLPSTFNYLNQQKHSLESSVNIDLTNNLCYKKAKKILDKLVTLAPNNCQVLERHIIYRCQMKLVSGIEGKKTKKLLTKLLNLTPNSLTTHQLKAYFYDLREKSST